jgi:uncharacterized protein (TIGR02145 family)
MVVAKDDEGATRSSSTWEFSTRECSYDTCGCGNELFYAGETYGTILIGSQCWLDRNLNIGNMLDDDVPSQDNGQIEKYCYDNDPGNCSIYGGLYQWNEMMLYSSQEEAQGICPDGWHIPDDEEWKVLEGSADSQYEVGHTKWDESGYRGFDAGKNLKSITIWSSPGIDLFGFTGLPGGYKAPACCFDRIGVYGNFWTSTFFDGTNAWYRGLSVQNNIGRQVDSRQYGFTVRCIAD